MSRVEDNGDREANRIITSLRREKHVRNGLCSECSEPKWEGRRLCQKHTLSRRVERTKVDPVTIYDKLTEMGFKEHAVLKLGDRYFIGRWISMSERNGKKIVLSGVKAIEVLAEGSSWQDVLDTFFSHQIAP